MGNTPPSTPLTADAPVSEYEPAPAAHPTPARKEPTPAALGSNLCVLVGEFAAEPDVRTLPSGTVAASFSVRVRAADARAESVPVVWYDPPQRLSTWRVGDRVIVRGAVVRRFYRGAGGLGSSTEVVISGAELLRHTAKAAKFADRAVGEFTVAIQAHLRE